MRHPSPHRPEGRNAREPGHGAVAASQTLPRPEVGEDTAAAANKASLAASVLVGAAFGALMVFTGAGMAAAFLAFAGTGTMVQVLTSI